MWGGPGLSGSRAVAAGSPAWPGPGKRGDPQQQPPAVLPSPEQPRLWEWPKLPGAGTAGAVWLLKGSVGQEASHAGSPTSFRRRKTPKLKCDSNLQAEGGRNETEGRFRKWGDNGTGHKRDACWHLCHMYHSRLFPSHVVSQKATADCFWKGAEGQASLRPCPSAAQGSTRVPGPSRRPWSRTGCRERSLARERSQNAREDGPTPPSLFPPHQAKMAGEGSRPRLWQQQTQVLLCHQKAWLWKDMGIPKTAPPSAERWPQPAPADSPHQLHEQHFGSRNTSKIQMRFPLSSPSFLRNPTSKDPTPSWGPHQRPVNQEKLWQSPVVFLVHVSTWWVYSVMA